jgi:hypothetical protein
MENKVKNRLSLIQRNLFRVYYKQARSFMPSLFGRVAQYSNSFKKKLSRNYIRTNKTEMISELNKIDVLLYGDFHTLGTTQQNYIKILEEYKNFSSSRQIIIAVEMFEAADQSILDQFMGDKISEDLFLQRVMYQKKWGFNWTSYKEILFFCKKENIKIFAINHRHRSLKVRDLRISQLLQKVVEKYPRALVACLIGEHHLGEDHLVSYLSRLNGFEEKNIKLARIISNQEHFFLKIWLDKYSFSKEQVLKIGDNFHCMIDTPPWIKWLSYSVWEDRRDEDKQSYCESVAIDILNKKIDMDVFEVEYNFAIIVRQLCVFWGIDIELIKLSYIDFIVQKSTVSGDANISYRIDKKNFKIFTDKLTFGFMLYIAGEFIFENLASKRQIAEDNSKGENIAKYIFSYLCYFILSQRISLKQIGVVRFYNVSVLVSDFIKIHKIGCDNLIINDKVLIDDFLSSALLYKYVKKHLLLSKLCHTRGLHKFIVLYSELKR